ncbi:hypothetical protein ACFUTX_14155 [Microbacterium sp. NPDC057407]|uniref:hypothetical protein n=1 Tax=Microbacterium sp. NPDC057407 TaxID=3346120 RepID=UPI00367016D0
MNASARTTTSRALAVSGTAITGIPLAAPLALALVSVASTGQLRFDALMPGELFVVVLVGAAVTMAAAFVADRLSIVAGVLAAAAVVSFGGTIWIADATGLASGATPPAGAPLLLMIAPYAVYVISVIGLFITGAALCRATFSDSLHPGHA